MVRLFELRIHVWGPDEGLPETFADWVKLAGFKVDGATPTRLESVVELRYPLAKDVVSKRTARSGGPW